jgi:hypothetical protein
MNSATEERADLWRREKLAEAESERDELTRRAERTRDTIDALRAAQRRFTGESRELQRGSHTVLALVDDEDGPTTLDPYELGRRAFAAEVRRVVIGLPLSPPNFPAAPTAVTADDLSGLRIRSIIVDQDEGIPWVKRLDTEDGGLWETTRRELRQFPDATPGGWIPGQAIIDQSEGRTFVVAYGAPRPTPAPETVESVVSVVLANALRELHDLDKHLLSRVLIADMMRGLDALGA